MLAACASPSLAVDGGLDAALDAGLDASRPDARVPVDAAPLPGRFVVVGHSDLGARGMNAGLALDGEWAYVGARNDTPGVLVVSVADPARPEVRATIAGTPGHSMRELRVVPESDVLVVIEMHCYPDSHACAMPPADAGALRIYDIAVPDAPALLETIPLLPDAHEMFLWRDPADPERSLLYLTTPPGPPALVVYEIRPGGRPARLLATFDHPIDDRYADEIHSISISDDGRTGYVAHTGAGFLLLDTSELASGAVDPVIRTTAIHDPAPPYPAAAHSFVPVPGRAIAITTDEVYPTPLGDGCPWGWMRVLDVSSPDRIVPMGELRLAENQPGACTEAVFTAHNPTPLENVALVSWYAGGLRAIDISDPARPTELAAFLPEPLARVDVEDPLLSAAHVMGWSYPVVQDGLVYLVDARNGLYVLRYEGPREEEIAAASFRDGSSNL